MTGNPKPRLRTASAFRSSKVGFPIRKSADQSSFAAPRGLSQRTTSFIASQRQGIHQMPLSHLIALIVDAHPSAEVFSLERLLVRTKRDRRIQIEKTSLLRKPSEDVGVVRRRDQRRLRAVECSDEKRHPHGFPRNGCSDDLPLHDVIQPNFPPRCFSDGTGRNLVRTSGSGSGGARRNRTDDLLLAKQALSQLSYGPAARASLRTGNAGREKDGGPGKI